MSVQLKQRTANKRESLAELYLTSRTYRILRKIPTYLKYHPPDNPYYLRVPGPHQTYYSDANPFKILWIDPDEIEYCSHRPYIRWRNVGKVKPGDWDAKTRRFKDTAFYSGIDASFYESFKSHFDHDVPWEETPFIEAVIQQVENGGAPWECASVEAVHARCERMDELYASIAQGGFKTQRELLADQDNHESNSSAKSVFLRLVKRRTILGKDEIAVDIARDGSILFYDSKNRLAIAKLLDLDEIPVRVVVRHLAWQRRRDRFRGRDGGEIEQPLHPDLEDLS